MAKKSNRLSILLGITISVFIFCAFYFGFNANPSGFTLGCSFQNPHYQVYFCPRDYCDVAVINQINQAEESIHIAMYSFTLDSIADSLIDAHNRGVEVKVILEKQQVSQHSVYHNLLNAGILVFNDTNPSFMHHKFAVIDGKIVITGSFNWSKNAVERNNENLMIINSVELASEFEKEFRRLWKITMV